MAKSGKRIRSERKTIDCRKQYELTEAVKLIKTSARAKFDETVEIFMNLGIDSRQADQIVRGFVKLQHGCGKNIKIAVFAKGSHAKYARECGADFVGEEDLVQEIQKNYKNYDTIVAMPNTMNIVARLGKLLGPRGLMPNPKLGTVTEDIGKTIKEIKSGQVHFKTEKSGIVSAGIGKVSFQEQKIVDNANKFIGAVTQARPKASKGQYIKNISVSSTMGIGLNVLLSSKQ